MDFEWDVANLSHIRKRNIRREEAEQAILDPSRAAGRVYSLADERREAIIGMASAGQLLFVVYTEREGR